MPVGERYFHERLVRTAAIGGVHSELDRWDVFTRPLRVTERWNADPWTPGALPATPPDGSAALCAGCREGDTFWPLLYLVGGDEAVNGGILGLSSPYSDDPDDDSTGVELYRNGQPVPMEPFLGIPAFVLPPDEADYRLVNRFAGAGYTVHTQWEFTSRLLEGGPTSGYGCLLALIVGVEASCRAEPLVFLRYSGLDTDLHHRVAAPGAHRFDVVVHRQPTTDQPPAVSGLTVEVSYDGGGTWERATVRPAGDGRYTVVVVHPPVNKRPADTVTIRAEAWDAHGNRVRQTITDAYLLTGRGPGQCRDAGCADVH